MKARQWFYARGHSVGARVGASACAVIVRCGMQNAPAWAREAFLLGFLDARRAGYSEPFKLFPHQRRAIALLLAHPTRAIEYPRRAGWNTVRAAAKQLEAHHG